MAKYRIALYPGDGIGVDVTDEAVKALDAASDAMGFSLEYERFNWGSAHWRETGKVVPEDFLKILADFDAVYLGAIGDPAILPDHVTLTPLIEMRQGFDQYACLRPAKLLPGVATPLAGKQFGDIDIMVLRENTEGEYAVSGGSLKAGQADEVSVQTAIHTRRGAERILRFGFELARKRKSHLTMATKSNALKFSMVMWDHILDVIGPEYADVRSDKCHVDALAMNFVKIPEAYDVVVASNLFGDILSDLGGAISGSLGLAPSANLNPEKKFPSLFEPVHGSAPDIAGKGIANPVAAIRSAAMMLDFLGEIEAAARMEQAVADNLAAAKVRTPDLGGSATTVEVGDDIAVRIRG